MAKREEVERPAGFREVMDLIAFATSPDKVKAALKELDNSRKNSNSALKDLKIGEDVRAALANAKELRDEAVLVAGLAKGKAEITVADAVADREQAVKDATKVREGVVEFNRKSQSDHSARQAKVKSAQKQLEEDQVRVTQLESQANISFAEGAALKKKYEGYLKRFEAITE